MKLKSIEIEAKTLEDALILAAEELQVSADKITLEVIKEKKGMFGITNLITYQATTNVSLVTEGKLYLEKVLAAMGIDVKMEIRNIVDENQIIFNIQTSENALLIGRGGKNLNALQNLLRLYLNQFTEDKILINLDIGGYHDNRKKQLEILATKTAKEVLRTGIPVRLADINSFERRIIHTKLAEWRDIETVSEGEDRERVLIIKLKK
ncbi:MAG: KH domain-containing protein [Acholeplasmataceae bacterium]|jgi:spoIIIJ-associated protein|nr:KH domain-containing protein [Acholeplasmataceae bacterium]